MAGKRRSPIEAPGRTATANAGGRAATGAELIECAFSACAKRAALMPYLMGGYPDMAGSRRVGETCAAAGADMVELGVPFSDPLADGPSIQAAGQHALEAGATFDAVVDELAAPLADRIPVVLMCYGNQVLTRGFERVAARLAEGGIAGLIVPDLPVEEAAELRAACDTHGVALVPLVAPTTTRDRLDTITAAARGFVYVVSVTGVTGERGSLPPGLTSVVERVRASATVPAAVGFGVGTPEQVAEVGAIADGVIVGSRLVRALSDAPTLDEGLAAVDDFLHRASRALA